MNSRVVPALIGFLTILSIFISLPRNFIIFNRAVMLPKLDVRLGNFSIVRDLEPKLGLDLSGGSHLVFEADMSTISADNRSSAHQSARSTVERRVNVFGVSEPVVQTARVGDSYRIIVELPGVTDSTTAINLIGQTAQLGFATVTEVPAGAGATPSAQLAPTNLTGADLVKAQVQFDNKTGKPIVGLLFNDQGRRKFGEITGQNIGRQIAILLDKSIISSPTVQEKIEGNAVITGNFSLEEARYLVNLLNAGALPVPLRLVEQRTIGPTLGQESLVASIRAGLVGIGAVALFMSLYYGRLGVIAVGALVIYGVMTFALFKLVPIVLTLPGIAGFLLSVGMAVDSNILIFERFKEEIRRELDRRDALEVAFGRAWDSIRDANIATLLTSFILFNPLNWQFLHTSGPVRGFAATLALGVLMSLFTGVVVTRTLLRVLVKK